MDRYDWRWEQRYGDPRWWYEREPWYVGRRGWRRPAWPYGADRWPPLWDAAYDRGRVGVREAGRRAPAWGYDAETRRGRYLGYGRERGYDTRYGPPSRYRYDEGYGHEAPRGHQPSDAQVRDAVVRSLRRDGYIDARAIEVSVEDRVVTLTGELPGYLEVRYAWDDAWDAPGVRGVVSRLRVTGQAP